MSLRCYQAPIGRLLLRFGVGAACVVPAAAIAQDGLQDALQEVVVTAQKREQNMQDVGISVAALSGDQLKSMGVVSVADIGANVPGVQIFQFGQDATTTITIRGV